MLSLGSTESDHVISEPCYDAVTKNRHYSKIIILGAITWPYYIKNRIVIRLNCNIGILRSVTDLL